MRAARQMRGLSGTQFAPMDALEARTLMAADLGIEIIGEPVLTAGVLVPNSVVDVRVRVTRTLTEDTEPDVAGHELRVYLSPEDAVAPAAWDLVFFGEDRGNVSFFGDTPDVYERTVRGTVPSTFALGSRYRVFAEVSGRYQASDGTPANNLAATGAAYEVVAMFGNTGATRPLITTLPLAGQRNAFAAFQLVGPGRGEVRMVDGRFDVRVIGTNRSSRLSISSSQNAVIPLAGLRIDGAISRIDCRFCDLYGPIQIDGPTNFVGLRDVRTPTTLNLSGTTTIQVRDARDLNIVAPDSTLYVYFRSWTVATPGYGVIETENLSYLTGVGNVLRRTRFEGVIRAEYVDTVEYFGTFAGTVLSNTDVATFNVWTTTPAFRLVARANALNVNVQGNLSGTVISRGGPQFSIGRDLSNATITAGLDLGSDFALGGEGEAADRYFAANMSLTVARNVVNSTVAVGREPIGDTGQYRFINGGESRIETLNVGGTISPNSRVLAGYYSDRFYQSTTLRIGNQTVDWRRDPRFSVNVPAPTATLRNLRVTTRQVIFAVDVVAQTELSDFSKSSAGRLLQITGPGMRSMSTSLVAPSSFDFRPFQGTESRLLVVVSRTFGGAFKPSEAGTYTISIRPNGILDNRLNAAPAGVLGTFTIG